MDHYQLVSYGSRSTMSEGTEEVTKNMPQWVPYVMAIVLGGGAGTAGTFTFSSVSAEQVMEAKVAATRANDRIDEFADRYSSTQGEFIELKDDVATLETDVGIIKQKLDNSIKRQDERYEEQKTHNDRTYDKLDDILGELRGIRTGQ